MLYEYAVEPQTLGSNWETFRYIIEKFGFDKGRLISEFPKKWFREVYDATAGLPPVQKKRIEEALNLARKNKVVRSRRPYDRDAGDWLHNALTEHQRTPFRAIIARQNSAGSRAVLLAEDIDELHPLMAVPHDCAISRDAPSLAAAMRGLLRFSSRILFVDPFFDPFDKRYKATLRECLNIVSGENPDAVCEIHYRYHDNKTTNEDLVREAGNLFPGVIPAGMNVSFLCWRQKNVGARFHARYLLTERGGIAIDYGFPAEGNHDTTDMHLMSFELSQERIRTFERNATAYELVEPVISVAGDGSVKRL